MQESFGSITIRDDYPEYVKKGLLDLDAISVRDENSKKIIKKITGREAKVVLDPTLIWDFKNDDSIILPSNERYIVVYGSFFSEKLINGAKEYCKKNKFELICLSSLDEKFNWCDKTINQDMLNPFEWAGFFKKAEAIMTCTYHGLLFGLIFEKKIVFSPTDFILAKANSLICSLDLAGVLINSKEFDEKMNWQWDYEEINTRLYSIFNVAAHILWMLA